MKLFVFIFFINLYFVGAIYSVIEQNKGSFKAYCDKKSENNYQKIMIALTWVHSNLACDIYKYRQGELK